MCPFFVFIFAWCDETLQSNDVALMLEVVNGMMDNLIPLVADQETSGDDSELLGWSPTEFCIFGDVCKIRGGAQNIQNSIVLYRAALKLTPADHANRAAYLRRLSDALHDQFCLLGNIADIKEAVLYQREVIQMTVENYAHLPEYLSTLGGYLKTSFAHWSDIAHLNMAIQYEEEAVNTAPQGHPSLPGILHNLGNSFLTRFEHGSHQRPRHGYTASREGCEYSTTR
jgi:hypothetical protein